MNAKQIETEITDEEYRDHLNEVFGTVDVCGQTFDAGYALQELDPTAFSCGKADHESNLDEENPRYECGECGEEFSDEDEAEECCQPPEPEDEEDEEA